jgi:mannose-6-phosphate isomerase-like protein (cupin superfamily)
MKINKVMKTRSEKITKTIAIIILFYTSNPLMAQADIRPDSISSQVVFTIENCVNEFSMDGTIPTKVGYQYWFVDKDFLDGRTLKMSVVEPGAATHPPHVHAEDEFFFILEGTAEFHLNGETKIANAYASFYCPANSDHGISNAGETTLKYLVIKKYNLK